MAKLVRIPPNNKGTQLTCQSWTAPSEAPAICFCFQDNKRLDDCCAAAQPYSQYYRPQAGHSGLSAKPLNAKQLRSDRGNGISIAANRFGGFTEA